MEQVKSFNIADLLSGMAEPAQDDAATFSTLATQAEAVKSTAATRGTGFGRRLTAHHKSKAAGAKLPPWMVKDIQSNRVSFMDAEVKTSFQEMVDEVREHFGHPVQEEGPTAEEIEMMVRGEEEEKARRAARTEQATKDIVRFAKYMKLITQSIMAQKARKISNAALARKQELEVKVWRARRQSLKDRAAWLEPHPMEKYQVDAMRIMREKKLQEPVFYRIPSAWNDELLKSKGFNGWVIDLDAAGRVFRVACVMGRDTLGTPIVDKVLSMPTESLAISWTFVRRALSNPANVYRVARIGG